MSGKGNEAAGGPEPLTESVRDEHETRMTYDPTGRLPWFVVVLWVSAMTGFAAYFLRYLVADLRQWGL
ncbi:MAG TPA: hypothetical protein VH877_14525 [Polyangia bacterium]|jgi:hypothetical protein|nr:hypothetical protein [Polyangia bacterium]